MPEPMLVKTKEFPDAVKQISWNKDEKSPLISVIVEGRQDITVLSVDGDQKYVLSGHSAPVTAHDWISPESIASISGDGEVRVWTMRGSRIDCIRIKGTISNPGGLVAVQSEKKAISRFATWYQGANVTVFEGGKPIIEKQCEQGSIMGMAGLDSAILVIIKTDSGFAMQILDEKLEITSETPLNIDSAPVIVAGCKPDPSTIGCFVIDEPGRIVSFVVGGSKVHVMDKGETITALCIEATSRTLLAGTKDGLVKTYAFRPDLSIIDCLGTFEAHEFKIIALAFIKKLMTSFLGSLDGLFKTFKIPEHFLQKSKILPSSHEQDWKEKDRADAKFKQFDDAIQKGDLERAREVITGLKGIKLPGMDVQIASAEKRMQDRSRSMGAVQATKQRFLAYLDKIAEDRGEIMVADMVKALGIPKNDVKALIKELDAEMDWEYVEQYECLFLFSRSTAITRETDVERKMARGLDERPRYTQLRQLGREGRRDVQPERQSQREPPRQARPQPERLSQREPPRQARPQPERQTQREPSRQARPQPERQSERPQSQPVPRAHPVRGNAADARGLQQFASSVKGQLKAAFISKDMKILATVTLPELSTFLETFSQPAWAILTDGIISPRLATQAENKGIEYIIGQRVHPNLDRGSLKVNCIEFDEITSPSFASREAHPR